MDAAGAEGGGGGGAGGGGDPGCGVFAGAVADGVALAHGWNGVGSMSWAGMVGDMWIWFGKGGVVGRPSAVVNGGLT